MKKVLKITGIVIGVVILVLILLAAALPFLINPNHYKDQIAKAVKDKTGRELNIEGDIKLSIFPWLGVQIGPMELSNAPGFSGAPFAAINESDVHVRFWPLLHGTVDVGEVKLDGLNLDLQRNAEGRNNWQDINEKLARGSSASSSSGGSSGATKLSVAGVSVSNSQVRWTDAQKHQQYTISDFTLKLGAFAPAEPVSLTTGFDFVATNPAIQGHADFDGTLVADLDHKIYSADDAKLELQAKGDAIPGGETQAQLRWKHVAANLDSGSVALNGLDLGAYGLTLHLEAQGKDIQKEPSFAGSVKLDAFSPRDVLKALGHADLLNTRDAGAFKRAAAAFGFAATTSTVSASDVDFTLDDTHLTGKAAVKDFKTQALSFDLNVDKLDADRYLPPPQPGTPDKPREETDVNKVGLPLRTLRSLNLDGHLHVGEFGLMNTKTTDFDMTVTAHDGLVHINPLSATLYSGSLAGDMQVDARTANGDQPIVSETLNLKGVQVGPLLKDFAKVDKLSGTLELGTSTRAQGRIVGELRHTLGGHVSFAVKNGALEGINVWDSIARGYATLKGQPAPPPAPPRTEFADLHGTGTITRGVLVNKDLTALLPFMAVTGAGKLDLVGLAVDYDVKGRITGSPNLGSGQDLSGLKGLTVPIHIGGTLSNLSVRPDLGGIVKGKVQEQLNKKKTDLKKKAKDKLKDLLQGVGGGGG